MKYSEKLKNLLKERKINQQTLATELDVTFAAFNRWVNEKSEPRGKNKDIIDILYYAYFPKEKDGSPENKNKIYLDTIQDIANIELLKKEITKKNKSVNIKNLLSRTDFVKNLIINMTYASNRLEGSTLTMDEVTDVIYHNTTFAHRTLTEHIEAKNHESAIFHVLDNYKNKISNDYICELNKILMNSIMSDAGKYRKHNVRIAGSYVPTANYLSIEKRMLEFLKYANTKNNDFVKFLAKTHADFEMIHPFADGNGRVGRLLVLHFCLQYNFLPAIIMSEKRRIYLDALQRAQLDGEYANLEKLILESLIVCFEFV